MNVEKTRSQEWGLREVEHRRTYWSDYHRDVNPETHQASSLPQTKHEGSTRSESLFSPLWISHLSAFAVIVNRSPEKRATLEVKTRSPSMKADSARVFNPAILAAITKRIVRIISQHLSIGVSTTKRSRPLACDLFSLRNRGRVMRQRVASEALGQVTLLPASGCLKTSSLSIQPSYSWQNLTTITHCARIKYERTDPT